MKKNRNKSAATPQSNGASARPVGYSLAAISSDEPLARSLLKRAGFEDEYIAGLGESAVGAVLLGIKELRGGERSNRALQAAAFYIGYINDFKRALAARDIDQVAIAANAAGEEAIKMYNGDRSAALRRQGQHKATASRNKKTAEELDPILIEVWNSIPLRQRKVSVFRDELLVHRRIRRSEKTLQGDIERLNLTR